MAVRTRWVPRPGVIRCGYKGCPICYGLVVDVEATISERLNKLATRPRSGFAKWSRAQTARKMAAEQLSEQLWQAKVKITDTPVNETKAVPLDEVLDIIRVKQYVTRH